MWCCANRENILMDTWTVKEFKKTWWIKTDLLLIIHHLRFIIYCHLITILTNLPAQVTISEKYWIASRNLSWRSQQKKTVLLGTKLPIRFVVAILISHMTFTIGNTRACFSDVRYKPFKAKTNSSKQFTEWVGRTLKLFLGVRVWRQYEFSLAFYSMVID